MVHTRIMETRMHARENCASANITYKWSLNRKEHMKIPHAGSGNFLNLGSRPGTILLVMVILGAVLVAG